MSLTCSSACASWTFSNDERLDVAARRLARARVLPGRDVAEAARRRAAPRRPASGTPRGSGRRTTPRARARRGTCSSPNSRKSATRPAFSSDWLSSSPLPGHAHVLPELLAQRGDLLRAPSRGPRSLRAMPQCSHMSWPSSRWNESTRALALDGEQPLDALARPPPRPRANSAWSSSTASSLVRRRGSRRSCTAGRSSRRPGPA